MSDHSQRLPGNRWSRGIWLIGIPAGLLLAILWFSPNFQFSDETVSGDPPGGDFLQEYCGGRLILDKRQSGQLYHLDTFRAVQHDPSGPGFAWNPDKYFPAVYPPFWYAAVSPLSRLEYRTAACLWLVGMTLCLIASLWLLWRMAHVPVPILVALCFTTPVLISLSSGQKGTLLLLILTASWCLFRIGRRFSSGMTFGLIAFKPHLGLPVGMVMLASRRWSWVLGTYATLLLLLIATAASGPQVMGDYFGVCLGFGDYLQNSGYQLAEGFSLWSALQLMTGDAQTARVAAASLASVIVLAALWYLRAVRLDQTDQLDRAVAALTLLTVVISPHMYIYDLTMLILPAALLCRQALQAPGGRQYWWPAGLTIGTMFAARPLAEIAAFSGFQPGVALLLIALGLTLRSVGPAGAASQAALPSLTTPMRSCH